MTELDVLLGDMVVAKNSIEEVKQKDREMKEQIEAHKEQIGSALVAPETC